jgi:hypothetical protein
MPCVIHTDTASTVVLFNWPYCASGWLPITGTGCAHYVAYQLGIQAGPPGALCLAGYVYRVPMVIVGRQRVAGGLGALQVDDIWVSPTRDHTGLISRIDPPPAQAASGASTSPVIWITHASSAQHRLATNRYDNYFHNAGDFSASDPCKPRMHVAVSVASPSPW